VARVVGEPPLADVHVARIEFSSASRMFQRPDSPGSICASVRPGHHSSTAPNPASAARSKRSESGSGRQAARARCPGPAV